MDREAWQATVHGVAKLDMIKHACIMLGTTSIEPIQCYWKQEKRLHSLPEIILHRIQEGSGSIREEVVKNSGLDLTKDQEPREPRLDTRKDEELGLAKFSRRGFQFS